MARLIFDLDGTLVDSAPTITGAANALLAELGRAPLERATVVSFVGQGIDALVDRLLETSGGMPPGGPGPPRARYKAIYAADPIAGTAPYRHVRETLESLAAAGHGLGVCTQKPIAPAESLLKGLGLIPPVSGLTGGDSLPVLKPDPRLVAHCAEQLPSGPVVFIGDSETDALTAANAGVPFLLHLKGYRHGPLEAIARAGEFSDFAELPDLLERVFAAAGVR